MFLTFFCSPFILKSKLDPNNLCSACIAFVSVALVFSMNLDAFLFGCFKVRNTCTAARALDSGTSTAASRYFVLAQHIHMEADTEVRD